MSATRRLAAAGCVAPEAEAAELAAAAADEDTLSAFVDRRTKGEPLAWITGTIVFCGCEIAIDPGVYVPRWQTEPLAELAAELLAPEGRAIDLGTGSGAIAGVLMDRRPGASVIGTENDPVATRCARRNGVEVAQGDLFDGIAESWKGSVDVIVGVLPYVPTEAIALLPRDVPEFEPLMALDGGTDGLAIVRRAVTESRAWLKDRGHLLLELGADQPGLLSQTLQASGFGEVRVIYDEEGDTRGVEALAVTP